MDIERLKEIVRIQRETSYDEYGISFDAQDSEAILDILDEFVENQSWIPCSERMPTEDDADENGHILAYSEGLQRSTICLWYHIIGDNTTTHWRKNIEPPKGE